MRRLSQSFLLFVLICAPLFSTPLAVALAPTCETADHDIAQMLLDTNSAGDFIDNFDPDGNGIACDQDGPSNADGEAALNLSGQPESEVSSPRIDPAWACANFDAWVWAQTAYEMDPAALTALDPDGNGIACEDLTVNGFGPVLWTSEIPAGAEAATIVSITDGDTFKVSVNGSVDTVRMYHIDTPETKDPRRGQQCGGAEASNFLSFVLGLVPNSTVYLEYDQTQRDNYDRRLAYVWYQIGSDVYMVNEVMVRNGWAESETYKPDTKYKAELDAAEQFSVDKVNGVRLQCGKFGQPADGTAGPSDEQVRQAMNNQPHQGQFAASIPAAPAAPAPAAPENVPAEAPADLGVVEAPPAEEAPAPPPAPSADCDPSYPDFCLAPSWVIGDMNCGDVPHRRFTVYAPDSHGFDGNSDGVGCEG